MDDLLERGHMVDLIPVRPTLRNEEPRALQRAAALSTLVVSTSGSPRANRSSGRWATLSIWPPEDSNRIACPDAAVNVPQCARRVRVQRPGTRGLPGDISVNGRVQKPLAQLAQDDTAELRYIKGRGAQSDEGLGAAS